VSFPLNENETLLHATANAHEEDFLTHLVSKEIQCVQAVFFHSAATGNIFKSKIISCGGKPTLFTKISYEAAHFNADKVITDNLSR
jgi:hypothetical protein